MIDIIRPILILIGVGLIITGFYLAFGLPTFIVVVGVAIIGGVMLYD